MNIKELRLKLSAIGIDERQYSLDGSSPMVEGYVLDPSTAWKVSYFERGVFNTLKYCSSESEACEFLYEQVIK